MEQPTKKTSKRRRKPTHSKKQVKENEFATNIEKCEYCDREVLLPFQCNFCGGKFCAEHRLPENHSCGFQPTRTPLGQWKAKYEHPSEEPLIPLTQEIKYQHPSEMPLKVEVSLSEEERRREEERRKEEEKKKKKEKWFWVGFLGGLLGGKR